MMKAGYNHARPIMGAGEPNHSPLNHDLSHTTHGGANSSKLLPSSGYNQRIPHKCNRCISGYQLRVNQRMCSVSSSVHAEGDFRVQIVRTV